MAPRIHAQVSAVPEPYDLFVGPAIAALTLLPGFGDVLIKAVSMAHEWSANYSLERAYYCKSRPAVTILE
jgi:hypothetical protein